MNLNQGAPQMSVLLARVMLVLFVITTSVSNGDAQPSSSSLPRSLSMAAEDRSAILALTQAYRDAWLANDNARVMATLTADAVLFPSGMQPVTGEAAIRQFWFSPMGPPTRVTSMEQQVSEILGNGNLAVVTGLGSLAFHMGDPAQTRTQRSWFINVVAKQADGRWLISKRMWSNLSR